jgi:PKD repeat protein
VVQVNVVDFPVADFTYFQNLDELYLIEFTSSTEDATSYFWDFGSGNTSNEANPSFAFPFDNDWPVSLIVTNSCGSDTLSELVTVIKLGFEDLLSKPISIIHSATGPIISGGFISQENVELHIVNLSGQTICEETYQLSSDFQIQPQLNNLSKGIYLISLRTSAGNMNFKWIN